MVEDPRKEALKNGLRQCTSQEIMRLVDHMDDGGPLLLDRDADGCANYSRKYGAYCPLAVAAGVPQWITHKTFEPSDDFVNHRLGELGFEIYNTRGIVGDFYTTHRWRDLRIAAEEVIAEKTR